MRSSLQRERCTDVVAAHESVSRMKSRSDCKGQAGQRTPSGSASGHGQAGGTVAARRADAIIFCPPTTHHGVHRVGARAAGEAQISSQGRAVQAEGVARNGAGSERHDVDALVGTGQRKDSRRSGWCRGGVAGSGAAEGVSPRRTFRTSRRRSASLCHAHACARSQWDHRTGWAGCTGSASRGRASICVKRRIG